MLTLHHPEGLSLNELEQLSVDGERFVSGVKDRIRELRNVFCVRCHEDC